MNLVAKEFVAARDDDRGVLVLSRFAGAAKQLTGALLINPYALDESASVLRRALAMPVAEQSDRMRQMHTSVATFSATWWAQQLVRDSARVLSAKTANYSSAAAGPPLQSDDRLGQKSAESHLSARWRMATR
jgi:trehalose-6-phosphate synthase